jgi:hypothetical protein
LITIFQTCRPESKFFYSNRKTVRGLRVAAVFLGIAILLPVCFPHELWAYFFCLFIAVATIIIGSGIYRKYKNKQPQIIISDGGIITTTTPFCSWKDISGEDAVEINEGKSKGYYLIYNYPYGHAKHPLSFLDTDRGELSAILKVYRGRNLQQDSVKAHS